MRTYGRNEATNALSAIAGARYRLINTRSLEVVISEGRVGSADEYETWEGPEQTRPGGHVIEGNTFRFTPNGIFAQAFLRAFVDD